MQSEKEYRSYFEDIKKYGAQEAIILYNLRHWVEYHKKQNTNIRDGFHWTYNSIRAMEEHFDCFTAKQISTALKNLEKKGAIKSECFNKSIMDRTKWYTIIEDEKGRVIDDGEGEIDQFPITPKDRIDFTKRDNRTSRKVEALPDIVPYTDNSVKTFEKKKKHMGVRLAEQTLPLEDSINYLNEKLKTHYSLKGKIINQFLTKLFKQGHTLDEIKRVIDSKIKEWGHDPKMHTFLRPKTLLGNKFAIYLEECDHQPQMIHQESFNPFREALKKQHQS